MANVHMEVEHRYGQNTVPCRHEGGCERQAAWRFDSRLMPGRATELCEAHAEAFKRDPLIAATLRDGTSRCRRIVVMHAEEPERGSYPP